MAWRGVAVFFVSASYSSVMGCFGFADHGAGRQHSSALRSVQGGGVYPVCAWPLSYDHRPSHPYDAGTEHVGLSPTRQTLLAPSAKRRDGGGGTRFVVG